MRDGRIAKVVIFREADGSHRCLVTHRRKGVWRKAHRRGSQGQAVSATILDFVRELEDEVANDRGD